MTIPQEHLQERLHEAYVRAVAAHAGYRYAPPEGVEYGCDGMIRYVRCTPEGKFIDTSWLFHVQMKATTRAQVGDSVVAYEMEVGAYNKLVSWEGASPIILLLMCLPDNHQDWLYADETCLSLRNCCYWYWVSDSLSLNSRSKTIYIPRVNLFTPNAVDQIMGGVKNGCYAKR